MAEFAVPGGARRLRVSWERSPATLFRRILALVLAVVIGAAYVRLVVNTNTSLVDTVWPSTFGTTLGQEQLIRLAGPLLLAGLSVTVALRMGLWNLGVPGQIVFGAWLAAVAAFSLPDLPSLFLIPLMLLAGMIGGMLWAIPPALARIRLGVSEVITTLLMNFIADLWLAYWATGPWQPESFVSGGALLSKPIPSSAELAPLRLFGLEVGPSFLFALVLAVGLWLVFRHSIYGYRAPLTMAGPKTASYAGFSAQRMQLSAFLLSGAIGGLLGVLMMSTTVHGFSSPLTADNFGYLGIVVALLAATSFLEPILLAAVLAILVATGDALSVSGVEPQLVLALTGLIVLIGACVHFSLRVETVSEPASSSETGPPGRPSAALQPFDEPARATDR